MLWIILQIIGFLLLSAAMHYGWNYMKDTMTIKKKKDTNAEIEKYKSLLEYRNQNRNGVDAVSEETDAENDLQSFMKDILV